MAADRKRLLLLLLLLPRPRLLGLPLPRVELVAGRVCKAGVERDERIPEERAAGSGERAIVTMVRERAESATDAQGSGKLT